MAKIYEQLSSSMDDAPEVVQNVCKPQVILGAIAALVFSMFFVVGEYFVTNWKCDPNALQSIHGQEYFPQSFTLDESAAGAMNWIGGRSVNVFTGAEQRDRVAGELPLGSFRKVWVWWGARWGYVEQTSNGLVLRFTATQTWPWLHSKWTVQNCGGKGLVYHIAREGSLFGSFDGTYHNIWLAQDSSGYDVKIASADHQTSGLNVNAGLFTGVDLNLKWNIVFKSVGDTPAVLAMAYQWYNSNLLANYGTSNWAVAVKNQSALPPGAAVLPAHVVAYTSAMYDLNTGSDRRRRTDDGGSFGRRRKGFFGGSLRRRR